MKVGIVFNYTNWVSGNDQRWIPAFAGMTVWRWYCGCFQGNDANLYAGT